MSANKRIVFTTAKPTGENKQLEQDADGYYLVILGGLNIFNENGAFYLEEGVKDLIKKESTVFYRRLSRGYLKGEVNHPEWKAGMSKNDYFVRCNKIDKDRVSHHIKEIILEPTDIKSGYGNTKIVLIKGWVKPSGPRGDELKRDLDDPNINVPFSIRSFTMDDLNSRPVTKIIQQIVTFDWVDEPGINRANKFSTLSGGSEQPKVSNESMELVLDSLDIEKLISSAEEVKTIVGHESVDIIDSLKEMRSIMKSTDKLGILNKW